jgi:hypothetical protein
MGMRISLYFLNSEMAIGSFSSINLSGSVMILLSDARSRTFVTPSRVVTVWKRIQSQPSANQFDVRRLSSEEQPARSDVILRRILFEHLGRIVFRLDRDRVEEDVFPHPSRPSSRTNRVTTISATTRRRTSVPGVFAPEDLVKAVQSVAR